MKASKMCIAVHSSFRRRPESSIFKNFWTSLVAGGDVLRGFFDIPLCQRGAGGISHLAGKALNQP